ESSHRRRGERRTGNGYRHEASEGFRRRGRRQSRLGCGKALAKLIRLIPSGLRGRLRPHGQRYAVPELSRFCVSTISNLTWLPPFPAALLRISTLASSSHDKRCAS